MKSPEHLSEGGKKGDSRGPTENSAEGQRNQGIIIGIIIQVLSALRDPKPSCIWVFTHTSSYLWKLLRIF